jgi:hypothetical protein
MKIAIAFLIAAFCAVGSQAQTNQRPASVSSNQTRVVISDNARFELVFLGSSEVVKLDRYTGRTYLHVSGDRKWYPLSIRNGLPNEAGNTTPKYQIYNDDGYNRLLFNNETGQAWILVPQSRSWEPMID